MTIERLRASLADRYTIERELGAGGMATVYLAHDLKHERQVAIKVLRPELAAVIGAERFLAEIKTTANLQHPHILPLFDSGVADSFLFYVMPYVEGVSLRDRITREHQLPVEEAVRLAREIAAALDYAHRRGVIHRDIKPENVMLHDGQALVADFGIALAVSSTAGTRMTETGMSLGTPHYMSPEQAMGEREITARSDVYALGAITYEMLCGEPPFTGPTAQAIIARVMTEEPRALTGQRKSIPPHVEAAVFTAIEKLPADRYASAADFAAALKDPGTTSLRTATAAAAAPSRRGWLWLAAAALASLAVGWAVGRTSAQPGTGEANVVRAMLPLGDSVAVSGVLNLRVALSPDGRRVAFAGEAGESRGIFLRELSGGAPRLLAAEEESRAPFFSPDGASIGYIAGPDNGADLKVISVTGGVARTIVKDSASGFGAAWGDDGNIYYSNVSRGLSRVPATGGTSTKISQPDSAAAAANEEHDYPDILPGSRHAIVTVWKGSASANVIARIDLDSGKETQLLQGTFARYLAPGFLVIGTDQGQLLVGRFNPSTGELEGEPSMVMEGVARESNNGTVQFAVSRTGALLYEPSSQAGDQLVWVDRTGKDTPVEGTPGGAIATPALSPQGDRIALAYAPSGPNQIWVKDLTTGSLSKLSTGVDDADRPEWSPDGSRIGYLGGFGAKRQAYTRRADGSDDPVLVAPAGDEADEMTFDPAGRFILLRTRGTSRGSRWIRILRPGIDSASRDLLPRQPFDRYAMVLAPGGRWIAYASNESGASQVLVRPFPNVDSARFAISSSGGVEPTWSRDGSELYFRGQRGEMYAVATTTGATFTHGAPTVLFTVPGFLVNNYHRSYDPHPDGKRFLMIRGSGERSRSLGIVLDWRAELESLGGTGQ